MRKIRIALAQINCTVGDLKGNAEKILEYLNRAKGLGTDVVSFPELALTGYPPEDLLLRPKFIEDNLDILDQIVKEVKDICAIVGFVDKREHLYNSAAIIYGGQLIDAYHKIYLPNYGVFDEKRYFQPGNEYPVYVINGVIVGVNICEDIWYPEGPTMIQALAGDAEVIININSSPYHRGKWRLREEMLSNRASENRVYIAYNNMVGGQDELVFDGHGMVFDELGNLIARGRQFEEDLLVLDLNIDKIAEARLSDPMYQERKKITTRGLFIKKITISEAEIKVEKTPITSRPIDRPHPAGEVYHALLLGTRDYSKKNGFQQVVIGLSGGIDSSLTAVIAVDALGKENVVGVLMPSLYTSKDSTEDVHALVKNLGIRLITIPIGRPFDAYLDILSGSFKNHKQNVTEENLQARVRGNILMALSNKFGWLVLTTGNKSEMSVGYATLYGDMAGGFAVIKDVPKTLVYELARYRNALGPSVIPMRVIEKEPTAELRSGQKDIDTLPPYDILDPILQAYVEEDKSPEEIISMGYDDKVVKRVVDMVDKSEYKRRQAPPGIKITPRAFGKDRRFPITNRYRGI